MELETLKSMFKEPHQVINKNAEVVYWFLKGIKPGIYLPYEEIEDLYMVLSKNNKVKQTGSLYLIYNSELDYQINTTNLTDKNIGKLLGYPPKAITYFETRKDFIHAAAMNRDIDQDLVDLVEKVSPSRMISFGGIKFISSLEDIDENIKWCEDFYLKRMLQHQEKITVEVFEHGRVKGEIFKEYTSKPKSEGDLLWV